jgi:methionine-rich copper-binding protein CopC
VKAFIASFAVASFLLSGPAGAHAHLQKSTPAEGSVLTSSPSTLEMTFSEAARLTALSIQKDQEPRQAIKSLPSAAEQTVHVALPQLSPGAYMVNWRVVSADGHVMSGVLHFTIAAKP